MPFDFGQCPVKVGGSVRMVHFVGSVFSESTRRMLFAYPAEDEECLFDAMECTYPKAGGITERSTLEDTKLAVAKVLEGRLREETEAYKRFRVLLGVTPRFTNVCAGSEKGHVEGTVGWAKRQVFPDLEVASWEELWKVLDEACGEDARTRRHCPERKLLEELFEEEGSSSGRSGTWEGGATARFAHRCPQVVSCRWTDRARACRSASEAATCGSSSTGTNWW